jgi:hypothetical protein
LSWLPSVKDLQTNQTEGNEGNKVFANSLGVVELHPSMERSNKQDRRQHVKQAASSCLELGYWIPPWRDWMLEVGIWCFLPPIPR